MTNEDAIQRQLELLAAHRYTLSVYLKQLALHGEAYAPPEVFHGIRDARTNIRHIKDTLRLWHVPFAEDPNDAQIALEDASLDNAIRQSPPVPPTMQPDRFVDAIMRNVVQHGFNYREEIFKGVRFNYVAEAKQGFFVLAEEYSFLITYLDDANKQLYDAFHETCISYTQKNSRFFQRVKYFVFIAISRNTDTLVKEFVRRSPTSCIKGDWGLAVFLVYDSKDQMPYYPDLKMIPHLKLRELMRDVIPQVR